MRPYTRCHVSTIDPSRLKAVNLDFDKIEKACGLSFNEDLRYKLKEAVVEYNNAKETYRTIDTQDVRRYLQKIADAIDTLMPVLSVLGAKDPRVEQLRGLSTNKRALRNAAKKMGVSERGMDGLRWELRAVDDPIVQAAWKHSIPHSMSRSVSEGMVRLYLEKWRGKAIEEQKLKGSAGKPQDTALRIFIYTFMHSIFIKAGGSGQGCCRDSYSDLGGYAGQFHALVLELLKQIDSPKAVPSTIGETIMEMNFNIPVA